MHKTPAHIMCLVLCHVARFFCEECGTWAYIQKNTDMCQDRSHSDTHVPHQIEICIASAYSTQCNFGDVQVQIEHMPNKQQNSEISNRIHISQISSCYYFTGKLNHTLSR